ncbi:hypothetical protein PI87_17025 [Ralstonia sp. A12]|uniref:DUF1120 domain-containing protein n=1 Tax=Ralstonia sp. A12 TaxID=1217052 RepID=UPI00057359D3|nr:DUF1120 domain-containing protein [Ralstonia sp. A12]KHK53546.1 hypothetical protein PI87_17025 [Ralstonia sp. A12]
MKTIRTIATTAALAALGLAFAQSAAAQSSGTLTSTLNVTGTLAPAACDVTFVGGDTIDFGNIASTSLSANTFRKIGQSQDKTLQVVCGANTNAFVSVQDNRAASAIQDPTIRVALGSTVGLNNLFGLGSVDGPSGPVNIGSYTIKMSPASVVTTYGGTSVQQPAVLSSADKSAWAASAAPVLMIGNGGEYYTAGSLGASPTPVAARTFNFPLTIDAALNNTTVLPLGDEVKLNGSATFTVAYQ